MCIIIIKYTIILTLLFSANADKSGNEEFRLSKLHYENSSGEKGITIFEYDEYGIMYKAKWELLNGSRHSFNYHTFDENGNMIQKYREFSDGITSNLLYKYDKQDNLISEHFERSDGVTGTTNYIYDETGKLISTDCKGLNGWFFGILTYKYEQNGKKAGATIKQKGNQAETISYGYDNSGNLIKEHWDFSGKWSQTFTYEYEKHENTFLVYYTSSNVFISNTSKYRLVEEKYDYNKSNGGPFF